MKTKILMKILGILLFYGSLFLIISCRSEQQNNTSENTNSVSFNIDVNDFGETDTNKETRFSNYDSVSRQELISGPFSIVSELSPSPSDLKKRAAISPRNFIGNNVKIRIVAYISETGEYADQLVTTVAGSKQKLFNLSGGRKYTFVTYCFNNTTDPPLAPATNLNQAKLSIAGLNGKEVGTDLLYAANPNVMLSGGNTTININLKHMFSRIFISVNDSDAAGTPGQPDYVKGSYALENNSTGGFTGSIQDFYVSGNMSLKDASITEGVNQVLPVPNITTTVPAAGSGIIINTGRKMDYRSKLIIPPGAIVIGHDTNSAPVSIAINGTNNNGLQPGKSYTLKLKFNSDRYADASGKTEREEAARYAVINGYRWDRYNVGVTNLIPVLNDPDVLSTENQGAKYMFGARTDEPNHYISQEADKTTERIMAWSGSSGNRWNKSTDIDANPIKDILNDPCDTGYRVATNNEYDRLVASCTSKLLATGSKNSYARQHYSKKSPDVRLTFLSAGFRGSTTGSASGEIIGRGNGMYYWTANGAFNGLFFNRDTQVGNGYAVRCIQE
ncbi:fimbrillin family protein [Elizabethkingia sp. HX QKY]|uniref:fimbrillin family protein n=1 Tax=Elizabethkingia TaxID=308865 RepID=UPI002A23DBCC|nr:fimbrillin family protein [Elizabethkingia sp. HX QKY]MDX8571490.1 fimbrillin family protein [Elizabethkingia sp. HX QKY]